MKRVSLVILTWNCLPYTQACIQSIRSCTQGISYEIIVVDNGSTDGTPAYLKEQPDLRLILNTDNQGYPRGNNQGIEMATGDYLLLLNNDVIVTPDWLAHLLRHFEHHPQLGLLGPRTNQISGEQKLSLAYNPWDMAAIEAIAKQRYQTYAGQLKTTSRLAGFCLMFSRQLMNQIGLLDERFGTGNFEDDDYCRRATLAGFELGIAEDVFVHHFGSVTFLENQVNYKYQMSLNRQIYVNKWGKDDVYEPLYPEVQRLIPAHFQRVLHVGCGVGSFGNALRQRLHPHQVTGVVAESHKASQADTLLDHVLTGPFHQVQPPPTEAPYDVVVFNECLERSADPLQLLQHWVPWLQNDGIVVATMANFRHFSVLKKLMTGQFRYQAEGYPEFGQLRWLTFHRIQQLFEQAGLTIDLWRSIALPPDEVGAEFHWQDFLQTFTQQGLLLNELISDMLVYRFIVVAGFKTQSRARQKRYQIGDFQLYWPTDSVVSDWVTAQPPAWISSVYHLGCNVAVHPEPPSDYRWHAGTLVHIARLNGIDSAWQLESKERLADMDEIWVSSEDIRQRLVQQGYSAEMIVVIPLLDTQMYQDGLNQIRQRLILLCKKMGILRSEVAE